MPAWICWCHCVVTHAWICWCHCACTTCVWWEQIHVYKYSDHHVPACTKLHWRGVERRNMRMSADCTIYIYICRHAHVSAFHASSVQLGTCWNVMITVLIHMNLLSPDACGTSTVTPTDPSMRRVYIYIYIYIYIYKYIYIRSASNGIERSISSRQYCNFRGSINRIIYIYIYTIYLTYKPVLPEKLIARLKFWKNYIYSQFVEKRSMYLKIRLTLFVLMTFTRTFKTKQLSNIGQLTPQL